MASPSDVSRYLFCHGLTDENGKFYLSDREPFRFVVRSDNRHHTVVEGDTLFSLAHEYFAPVKRPAGLYWVIADFQPDPIIDPTLRLVPGTTIVIPSVRCFIEEIFNEARRAEFGA